MPLPRPAASGTRWGQQARSSEPSRDLTHVSLRTAGRARQDAPNSVGVWMKPGGIQVPPQPQGISQGGTPPLSGCARLHNAPKQEQDLIPGVCACDAEVAGLDVDDTGFLGARCPHRGPHKREAGIWRQRRWGDKSRGKQRSRGEQMPLDRMGGGGGDKPGDAGSSRRWQGEEAASPCSLQKEQILRALTSAPGLGISWEPFCPPAHVDCGLRLQHRRERRQQETHVLGAKGQCPSPEKEADSSRSPAGQGWTPTPEKAYRGPTCKKGKEERFPKVCVHRGNRVCFLGRVTHWDPGG